jgi:hypothetical protein
MTHILLPILTLVLLLLTILLTRKHASSEGYAYSNVSGIYPGWKPRVTENSMYFPSLYNPTEEALRFCAAYGKIKPPTSQEDCPDSSFDFVDAQHMKVYTGQTTPSCMQLRALNYPNCYSKPDGTFTPWWFALDTTSP